MGDGPASEPETVAMEALYRGDAFGGSGQIPAAVVSYHSYADMLIYPEGISRGGPGPDCTTGSWNNCFNADFWMARSLFGDTHRPFGSEPFWMDEGSGYYRDHGRSILYGVSGDTGLNAMICDPTVA